QVTGNEELLETVADPREAQRDGVEAEGIRKTLERCLAQLTDRERAIVVRHFGLKGEGQGETLDQIGKGFGVTKERVRQIERNAIRRLREILLEEQSSLAANTG
ncbi:MAG: sigma-70 family RNA polymerase sigma factor, partial [Phycisphaerae bacterium]